MTEFKYCVYCEDEPAICFNTEADAMKFAREDTSMYNSVKVEKSEIDEAGKVLNTEVIWTASGNDIPEKEIVSDNEFETEFPESDIANIDTSDDIDYDELASQYQEDPADWIDDNKLIKEAVDALEENEDEVECKICFELGPKAEMKKLDIGYVCPKCAQELQSHQGTNLDLIDEDPFSLNYEDPRDFDEPEEIEVKEAPVDANEVRKFEAGIEEKLEEHINDRPADIESDQVLQGADNAVVDCEVAKVIAHSEDEKPLDCKMEKPALEEPLAGEEVDVKLNEGLKVIIDFSEYKPWSGAVDTYELIEDAGKLDDLEAYLEECYPDGITAGQINDILWFDSDQILSYLDLGDTEEDEEVDESLKEYWWEDDDPMNWSDKEPLVYSCYYNYELLGYLEYPYMGPEGYPTTIEADIAKYFELPEGYNPEDISWQNVEWEYQLDETKPLIKVEESLNEETLTEAPHPILYGIIDKTYSNDGGFLITKRRKGKNDSESAKKTNKITDAIKFVKELAKDKDIAEIHLQIVKTGKDVLIYKDGRETFNKILEVGKNLQAEGKTKVGGDTLSAIDELRDSIKADLEKIYADEADKYREAEQEKIKEVLKKYAGQVRDCTTKDELTALDAVNSAKAEISALSLKTKAEYEAEEAASHSSEEESSDEDTSAEKSDEEIEKEEYIKNVQKDLLALERGEETFDIKEFKTNKLKNYIKVAKTDEEKFKNALEELEAELTSRTGSSEDESDEGAPKASEEDLEKEEYIKQVKKDLLALERGTEEFDIKEFKTRKLQNYIKIAEAEGGFEIALAELNAELESRSASSDEEASSEESEVKDSTPVKNLDSANKNRRIRKILKDAGVKDEETLSKTNITALRKYLFGESFSDALVNEYGQPLVESASEIPFDSDIKVGDKIRIGHLEGEDNSYDGKEGEVEHIDSLGQLHGTWGGLAVIPGVDSYEVINEELIEAKAKPEGDKKQSYNNGLKLAKLYNKPVIYGYTNSSYGNKFFELDDPIICNNVSDETKKFRQQYKSCNIAYVAYPSGSLLECLLEDAPEGATEVDYVEYKHSYCHALEPKLEELKKIGDIEELKKAILDIINNDPQVKWTKKEKKFAAIVRHKKWKSVEDLKTYLDNSFARAKEIKVLVDQDGELLKKLTEEIEFDENGDEIFTPEEQEEFDCDEWGYSNEGYDQFHHCGWCEEIFPESEMRHEVDFGWICDRCEDELKSHGGPLTFIED